MATTWAICAMLMAAGMAEWEVPRFSRKREVPR